MEDLKTSFNLSVRNANGTIIQFLNVEMVLMLVNWKTKF